MILIEQIKAARSSLNWEQKDLAEKSGLSLSAIQRMERLGLEESKVSNVQKICQALESAGIKNIVSIISIKQIKAARLFLNWEQKDLAEKADLSLSTIQRMERLGLEESKVSNVQKICQALEGAGIIFIMEGDASSGDGPGVRLRYGPIF